MSGLIQRLLDRSGGPVPAAAKPVAASGSPLAVHDQRLQDPSFRDLAAGIPLMPEGDDSVADGKPQMPDVAAAPIPKTSQYLPIAERVEMPRKDRASITVSDPLTLPRSQAVVDPIAALRAQARDELPEQQMVPKAPIPAPSDTSEEFTMPVRPFPAEVSKAVMQPLPVPEVAGKPQDIPAVRDRSADVFGEDDLGKMMPVMPQTFEPQPLPVPEMPDITPEVMPEPAPQVTLEPAPQMARPAAPQRPLPEMPRAQPEETPVETPRTIQSVERVVEKVIAQEIQSKPQVKVPVSRPTAQSVSRIGQLPTRRRVHTLFGLRRG